MGLLYKILRQQPGSREGIIVTASSLNLLINMLVAIMKIVLGLLSSSIAIISDGVHNATDAASSLLTLVGLKLSTKKPTKKYPYGFGRIEYLTSLVISVLILMTGFELLTNSVKLIFEPAELDISFVSLALIAIAAVQELILGHYTVKAGKKADSPSLVAVGTESRNDFLISSVTIISSLLFIFFGIQVDAWAGIITSLFILKAGLEVLGDTVARILGKSDHKEMADMLYKEIRENPIVLNAADMMIHNYGPDAHTASVNIEVDHKLTVEEVYAAIHELQLKIMHEHDVTMVFGIYAVDNDNTEAVEMRAHIASFVASRPHVLSYHALFINPREGRVYCDLIVDYDLHDWEALRAEFTEYMAKLYPHYSLELVIETEYV